MLAVSSLKRVTAGKTPVAVLLVLLIMVVAVAMLVIRMCVLVVPDRSKIETVVVLTKGPCRREQKRDCLTLATVVH